MLGRIIFGLIGIPLGVTIIIKTHYIVDRMTGPLDFAESWFSSFGSGTYTFFRLAGLIIAVASMLVMFGFTGWIYQAIVYPITGGGL